MSIQDERDLRAQLVDLFEGVEVRPAPVAAAIRRGRRIRLRRCIPVAVGLAGAATLAAVLAGVLTGRPHSAQPLAPQHYTVSVEALGPIARGGVIAEGVVNGRQWKVVASGSTASPTVQAVGVIGAGPIMTGPVPTPVPDPVDLLTVSDARFDMLYGTVSYYVTSVVAQLPDGEQLRLIPVSWGGYRWVGLVLPAPVPTVRVIAYSGSRELTF